MESNKLFEEVQAAMANGQPIARFMKTILGRLNVKTLDQVTGIPVDVILDGDASKGDESAILTFWTRVELAYFERANKIHIAKGMLVPYVKKEEIVANPNSVTDEEITQALSAKYFTMLGMLKKFTSPVPAQRMLALAESMNKPIGTINAIKARLSELQAEEFEHAAPTLNN